MSVAAWWQEYEKRVIHPRAGVEQRRETKRAFYAGAWALLTGLVNEMDESSDDYTEADGELLGGLIEELEQFARDVEEGTE